VIALVAHNRKARLGLILLGVFTVVAVVGPLVTGDPDEPVGVPLQPPSAAHWLGTTGQGQDVLAQTVVGTRHSLLLGVVVAALVVGLGALVGTAAGTLGGLGDELLSLLINLFLVLPGLPLMVVMAAYLPPGPIPTAAALVVTGWAWSARVFRAQARSLRTSDFVSAAVVAGESPVRVMGFEILPHMTSLLVSGFIGAVVYAIGAEAGLEFLGLGDLGRVSWGTSLYWARSEAALITGSWWTFVPAGVCVGLVGFALALINRAVDELSDPRLSATPAPASAVRTFADSDQGQALSPGAGLLVIEDLQIRHGATRVLDGVSLALARGEAVGLVGSSGSGKSTLALAVLRLLPPSASIGRGRIRFDGADVLAMDEGALRAFRGGRVALVPQQAQSALSPFLTVEGQLLDAVVAHEPMAHAPALARAADLLELVGLPRVHLRRYPHELSAGMRQRVVIAIALAGRPALLVLDEPTSALDAVAEREILGLVAALKQTLGLSLLFIGHNLAVVRSLCPRVMTLRAGHLIEEPPAPASARAPRMEVPPRSPLHEVPRNREPAPASRVEVPPRSPLHEVERDRVRPSETDAAPVLSVRGLRKTFRVRSGMRVRLVPAVIDVSFDLERGKVLALVGESGCGKTTTARLIARLVPATAGEIRLDGRDVLTVERTPSLAFRARVQMVFQDPFASLNPVHTVGYHLARPLLRHRRCKPGPELDAAVAALLEAVGLPADHARRLPHQLSGGQRQRVAIARALAPEPAVLVADEPTSMLDLSVRGEVLELLEQLGRERGLATLHITHDLAVARAVADRVAVMRAGAIVELAPTRAIFEQPSHPYTRLLLSHLSEGPS
jgi:ABC-type glutathione transport system ATPase component/ABC-type dipeptide/oligopeptide/nickel transport system permease subunit